MRKKWFRKSMALFAVLLVAALLLSCAKEEAPPPAPPKPPAPPTKPAEPAKPAGPEYPKPAFIRFESMQATSAGFPVYAAQGAALWKLYRIKPVMVPATNDIARIESLRRAEAHIAFMGAPGSYMIGWGIGDYTEEAKKWGPQRIQTAVSQGLLGVGLIAAADSGIKTLADVKGKRLAHVPGGGATPMVVNAVLAASGLEWGVDFEIREFSSFSKCFEGVIQGLADVGYGSPMGGYAINLEASPHGARVVPVPSPQDDPELWKRIKALAPFVYPVVVKDGAGCRDTEVPFCGFQTGSGVLDFCDPAVTYWWAKAMWNGYDLYKDISALALATDHKAQLTPGVTAWHAGAVAFYKEIGVWTPELEAFNQEALAAEEERIRAWEEETGRKHL